MSVRVEAEELELMQRRAAALNLYVNEHRNYDPLRGNGSLFVIEKRRHAGQECKTFLKYAYPDKVWQFLDNYKE